MSNPVKKERLEVPIWNKPFLTIEEATAYALKGMRVEGMEINNLIGSMLQDYAYILKGIVYDESMETAIPEIIIKIPMEIQSEFENKYNINDLLIGHVSIVGIYNCLLYTSDAADEL